ncbi:hypothetical protein B0H13DRAFT_2371308 [Mycena leptocephala]|nr:hypothetical protein B0H13DRAFT_2371308 [Mycena leptocephala]
MGAKIEDSAFRTIFISLLGEEWDNVVPVLHTFKTSSEVISFVTMHAERLNRIPSSSSTMPTTALAANTYNDRDARRAARKNLMCSNAQCGAPGRKGHSIADCFWPGGGKEGQWPAWWKGKRPSAVANNVETFAFTMWTVPEAIVNVYDGAGSRREVIDATVPVVIPESIGNETSSNAYLAPTSESFELVDNASLSSSEFELVEDSRSTSEAELLPALEPVDESDDDEEDGMHRSPRRAPQSRLQPKLSCSWPAVPGDDHIQEEQRFLVYQTSDTEHVIMDNMIDEDHRRRTLGLPEEDDNLSDTFSDRSDDTDSDDDHDDGPDGSCGGVSAFVAESQSARKYIVVVDSGARSIVFGVATTLWSTIQSNHARGTQLKDRSFAS